MSLTGFTRAALIQAKKYRQQRCEVLLYDLAEKKHLAGDRDLVFFEASKLNGIIYTKYR